MANKSLQAAKVQKNDEFYTQLSDIENELSHYKQHFKDKTIFCNCDNPEWSNFWKYFCLNFNDLGLKKLVATHYDPSNITYKTEYYGIDEPVITILEGNGDFRSNECIEILKEADIVVSNPPFSLFRSYISQLFEHKKKFIVIGNINAITYKEFFPLIKENKVWLGYCNGAKTYRVSDNAEGKSVFIGDDGKRYQKHGNTVWFTNLNIRKRHQKMSLHKTYKGNEDDYLVYDNYAAFNVNKTADIPIEIDFEMVVTAERLTKLIAMGFDIEIIEKIDNT